MVAWDQDAWGQERSAVRKTATLKRASPFASPEDRDRERQLKREAVLSTAASLFCERGYNVTQMDDVAKQLGVTKPTIYYYFKNKEEVLVGCFQVGFELIESTLRNEGSRPRNGAARLRDVLLAYAEIMTQDYGKCTVRISTHELSAASRLRIDEHRRKFDGRIRSLVADAVKDGSIRPCDPKIATFTILGSLNWIAQWHKPEGQLEPAEIAHAVVGQLLAGLETAASRHTGD